MTKPGKLSNIEKYCIQGMVQDNKSVEEIAIELNRKEESISKYLDSIESSLAKIETNKEITAKDLIIKKTGSGKKGVAIMTEAASQQLDGTRNQRITKQSKLRDAIHKIYPDE